MWITFYFPPVPEKPPSSGSSSVTEATVAGRAAAAIAPGVPGVPGVTGVTGSVPPPYDPVSVRSLVTGGNADENYLWLSHCQSHIR